MFKNIKIFGKAQNDQYHNTVHTCLHDNKVYLIKVIIDFEWHIGFLNVII